MRKLRAQSAHTEIKARVAGIHDAVPSLFTIPGDDVEIGERGVPAPAVIGRARDWARDTNMAMRRTLGNENTKGILE